MKSEMLSVVVGTEECIARCPFCVSREDVGSCPKPNINFRNFKKACLYAEKSGVTTVELTGRGEPLLYPSIITSYLQILSDYSFPFVELQTNAILIGNGVISVSKLREWYDLGLTHIAISTVSHIDRVNAHNYNVGTGYPSLKGTVGLLHDIGFTVRLVCVMCMDKERVGYVHTHKQVKDYINFARSLSVEQVTLRPLNQEFRRQDAHDWCEEHLLDESDKLKIFEYLSKVGTPIREIPRVGTIFDVDGQNVMLSIPMNKYTPNSDSESTRQLIYFPDGRLRYEWEKFGAVLL